MQHLDPQYVGPAAVLGVTPEELVHTPSREDLLDAVGQECFGGSGLGAALPAALARSIARRSITKDS